MVLVVAESQDGKIRKASLEAVYYGSKVGELNCTSCTALILGP
jgi:electron transfer flavoprotein alpha subunit